jgi:hypothetical protein
LGSSDSRHSHGVYDVPLGLHAYLRNGGRSRLEIQVEFHEGAVPLSTLLGLYCSHSDDHLLSVRRVSYLPLVNLFLDQVGKILKETGCRKITIVNGGS